MAGLLDRVAAGIVAGVSRDHVQQWLEDARRLNRHVPRVDRALVHAEESRRLNLRALGVPETGLGLRGGLEALEHCSVSVRSLCRSILDAMRARPDEDEGYPDEIRQAFAVLLQGLAAAVRTFGRLVRAEVEASGEQELAALSAAVHGLRAGRARVTDLLLVDPREDPAVWELNSTLLATVDRVLGELDVEEHARLRERRLRETAKRPRSARVVDRLRTLTRQIAERPRRRRRGEPPATTAE
jgi:hypothetical protein